MTCEELDNLLHPYVDGEFDAAEREAFEAHLLGCQDCRQKVLALRSLKAALRSCSAAVPTPDPGARAPDALRDRIRGGIRQEERRRVVRRSLTVGAAAAAVLAMGAVSWSQWPRARDRFIHDAARYHARPLPHEIAQRAHHEIEAWFGGKLDHRVMVPRLRDASVTGARISHVQDRPAAYITYQVPDATGAARDIGLFVFGDADNDVGGGALPAVEVERRLGYNVALWRDGEIVYELVSDLDEHDIRAMLNASQPERPAFPAARPPAPGAPERPLQVRPASLQQ